MAPIKVLAGTFIVLLITYGTLVDGSESRVPVHFKRSAFTHRVSYGKEYKYFCRLIYFVPHVILFI